jgi:anaerobic magnesium-protoporphyrin IX monomethyl ester cyclase
MNRAPFFKGIDVDLMLVFPPFQRLVVSMENIGIAYIAAAARSAGFSAAMINAGLHGLDAGDVSALLERSRFRVLGISTLHWTLPAAVAIARAARASHPDAHIIFGGIEAALDAERILQACPFVNSVGLGEGERTVVALLAKLAAGADWRAVEGLAFRDGDGVRYSPPARLIEPLDDLPFPARDDMAAVRDGGGAASMSSSRGCPGRCTFCSVRAFYGRSEGPAWRGRSPRSVVAEMQELYERHGTRLFAFIDETVVGPGEQGAARLQELAACIREAGLACEFFMTVRADQVERSLFKALRAAGLRKVEIGIESMSPSQLKRYGKIADVADNRGALRILEELGIAVELFMVPFDPGLTPQELADNLAFYRDRYQGRAGYDVSPLSMGNYLYPYPGTETRRIYDRNGWLAEGGGHARCRALDPRMQRVGEMMNRLTGAVEPAFPMSYLGLGNLWVNGARLSAPVYERIGAMCAEIGALLVAVAEWATGVTGRPLPVPIGDVAGYIRDLRRYLAEFGRLQDELRGIVDACHEDGAGPRVSTAEMPDMTAFAAALYELGRDRKRRFMAQIQGRRLDAYDIITDLVNTLTREDAQ